MKRGDLYIIADGAGDFSGKPRPALIIQTDIFNETHQSVTVCPVTSNRTGDRLFRVALPTGEETGLRRPSEVQIDKLQAVKRAKVAERIGRAPDATLALVDDALRFWLHL